MATVRATCPHCKQTLLIPIEWAERAVKCKNCFAVVKVGGTASQPPLAELVPPAPPPEYVPQAMSIAYPPPAMAYAPPTYAQPVYAQDTFVPSETTKRYRGKKRGGGGIVLLFLGLMLLAGGAVAGALFGKPLLDKLNKDLAQTPTTAVEPKPTTVGTGSSLAAAGKAFPRRLLVLSTTKYLYCNPLSAGNTKNEDMVGIAARRLAFQWKIPQDKDNNQLFILQDVGSQARAMLKPIIAEAVTKFLETSRSQDRILIYFGGHAVIVKDQAYLVPVDGDLTEPSTLLPLKEFWQQVKDCKATQKVVVFDVCRLNEDGDKVRPGSEPMSEALEKQLLAAPPGVQVVTTAAAGQNAHEFRFGPADAPNEGGSLFLSSIIELAAKGKVKLPKDAAADDPLPIAAWSEALKIRMKEVAGLAGKADPGLKLVGEPAPLAAATDEPPAVRFPMPQVAKGLPPAEIAKLLDRIGELPPYRGKLTKDDAVETLFPFSAEVMAKYRPDAVAIADILKDGEKYPIRKAAVEALDLIKKEWRSSEEGSTELRTMIQTAAGDAFKKTIMAEQETPARIEGELEAKIVQLEKLAQKLDEEKNLYWRITFEYALAQMKARLAFMSEYNLALGNIRTDNLPKVDEAKGQSGLVLVASDKMKSKKEVKETAEAAQELFLKIAKEHPGTPWAVLAKRHSVMGLGLEWKPYTMGNSSKLD